MELARRAGLAALEAEGVGGEAEAAVVLVGDGEIAAYNQRWLGREGPTDVIAFAAREGVAGEAAEAARAEPLDLGDVFVSVDRARSQAAEYGCTLEEEVARLVVHGVLHLLGWDDTGEEDARRMSERTEAILAGLFGGAREGR